MKKKQIIITGATGLIGKKLCAELIVRGNEVTVFSRNSSSSKKIIHDAAKYVDWDYHRPELWKHDIDGSDAVMHLAGASIAGKRWNDSYKKIISDSRIISTKNLAQAIIQSETKPKVFITASGSGYYGNRGSSLLNENSGYGSGFLGRLCNDWESEANIVESHKVRRVSLRTGVVLTKEDGALEKMLLPFKLFIGGPLGNSNQWFPWIHIDDIVQLYIYAIENESLAGSVNAAAPQQIRMNEFAKTLGKVLNRPSLLPVPEFLIRIAAGEVATEILSSQKLDVSKLLKSGFKFRYENLEDALQNLLK